jgi:hypothetical protein
VKSFAAQSYQNHYAESSGESKAVVPHERSLPGLCEDKERALDELDRTFT